MKRSRVPRAAGKAAHSVHNAAIALVEHALQSLEKRRTDESVHTARKACKRARAALRLMQLSLGPLVYRLQNLRIRDAAKPLTAVRDAFVLKESLDALHTHCPELRRALVIDYRAQRQAFEAEGWKTSLAKLQTCLKQLKSSRALASETESIVAGARKVYKAGRSAFADANSRTDEALHECRKQAKYLSSVFELIRAAFRARFKKGRRSARKLAEILGEDHDLAVLVTILQKHRIRHPALTKEIKKRRRELQRQARRAGAKLYRMGPRRFKRRLLRRLAQGAGV